MGDYSIALLSVRLSVTHMHSVKTNDYIHGSPAASPRPNSDGNQRHPRVAVDGALNGEYSLDMKNSRFSTNFQIFCISNYVGLLTMQKMFISCFNLCVYVYYEIFPRLSCHCPFAAAAAPD